MFKCQDCLYLTDRRHNLNRHIKTKHQTCQKESKTSFGQNTTENGSFPSKIGQKTTENGSFLSHNGQNTTEMEFFHFENSENFAKKNGKTAKNAKNENMVCQSCEKIYKTKKNYEKHIKTCINTPNNLQCPFCHKILSSSGSKSRHMKICQTKECHQMIQLHKQSNEIIPSQTENQQTNNNNSNNNNNQTIITHTHTHNHYNIKNIKTIKSNRPSKYSINYDDSSDDEDYSSDINQFGNESIDYISQETLDDLTKHINIKELIKLKHFNPDHPENHNIRHNTTSKKSLKVFKDNEWQVHPKDEIFEQIFIKSKSQLFNISLDLISSNRHNLTDGELMELSERWLNYDKQNQKRAIEYINIQLEELIKNRNKNKNTTTSTTIIV
jgi:uncharacterized C2H2 Zn-finger protein